jgi:CMP-N-acetylneuraminic acid synthetase/GT2 family glycosyltransferase
MFMKKLVSIIIRTNNEEKWINSCLRSVFEQDYDNFEVVLVDDHSDDRTLEIASTYPIRLVNYDQPFFPGLSLNMGIRESKGEYIVCLSGHCVPIHNSWLKDLIDNFKDPKTAAVYGRQEPLPYSSDTDKRDLWTIFGLDRKVQKKDSFFHNANSMLRREIWNDIPFDEKTTNIEDRIWAKTVIEKGYQIIYEPKASVYHWHGIHQDGNKERLRNVVKIVESLELVEGHEKQPAGASKLNITAVIPIKGSSLHVNGGSLLSYSVARAVESDLVDDVVVATDSEETAALAESLGASAPFLRPKELSYEYVGLNRVMSYTISQLQLLKRLPDLVVILQETHPFRKRGFIDAMIREMLYQSVDTLLPVRKDYNIFYKKENNSVVPIDKGLIPERFKEPLLVGIVGLGLVTKPQFLKDEMLTGHDVGVFPVDHRLGRLEIKNKEDAVYFGNVLKQFWEANE